MRSHLLLFLASMISSLVAVEVGMSGHRGLGTGVYPATDLPTEFWDVPDGFNMDRRFAGKKNEYQARVLPKPHPKPGDRKNVLWRATLPHWGNNAPLVVGDKVFVMTEPGWKHDAPQLVCLSVVDGKILWQADVDHLDGLPAGKQEVAKAARANELKRFREYMYWWNRIYAKGNWWARRDEATYEKLRLEAKAAGWIFKPGQYKWPERGNNSKRSRFGISYNNGKQGGVPADGSLIKNFKTVVENQWHLYQGWTTEKCWYGLTQGSIVSDGDSVYAVTALGGAAAFSLDGKRRWAHWLKLGNDTSNRRRTVGNSACEIGNIASPILADGKLIYFDHDNNLLSAVEVKSGKIVWQMQTPTNSTDSRLFTRMGGKKPVHFGAHMGPGSSPVALNVGGIATVVTGNGAVVRLSDGKLLGVIKSVASQVYWEWVGSGDLFYCAAAGKGRKLQAVRLGMAGEKLIQEVLWTSVNPAPGWEWATGLILDGDKLYVPGIGGKNSGMCILDAKTGKVVKKGGAKNSNYGTTFAVSDQHYVVRKTKWDQQGWAAFEIFDRRSWKVVGKGLLCQEPARGEMAERHISLMGWPELEFGVTASSAWGNRLFIRSNDYLWCIGKDGSKYRLPE